MKFNIDDYKGKYAMHCKTKEEAEDFCRYLDSIGQKWKYGISYIRKTFWNNWESETAYDFNSADFGRVSDYKNNGYKILVWSNFMNDTKGNERIDKVFDILGVEPFEEFIIADEEYAGVKYYIDYDLKIYAMPSDSDFEMEEERSDIIILDILKNKLKIQRIYKPTKKEQLAIDYARALGCKWIAKDKEDLFYAFTEKPHKTRTVWNIENGKFYVINIPISFIHWDDDEPYYIGD